VHFGVHVVAHVDVHHGVEDKNKGFECSRAWVSLRR